MKKYWADSAGVPQNMAYKFVLFSCLILGCRQTGGPLPQEHVSLATNTGDISTGLDEKPSFTFSVAFDSTDLQIGSRRPLLMKRILCLWIPEQEPKRLSMRSSSRRISLEIQAGSP